MIYFVGELLVLCLFTALLWFGIGWWVSGLEGKKSQRAREQEWRHYLNTLRRDRDTFRDEVEKAHGRIRVLENRRADGKSPPKGTELDGEERQAYRHQIEELQDKYETTERKMLGFSQHVESLHQQNLEREDLLVNLKQKLTDTVTRLKEREQQLETLNSAAAGHTVDAQSQTRDLQNLVLSQQQRIDELQAADQASGAQQAAEFKNLLAKKDAQLSKLRDELLAAQRNAEQEAQRQVNELKHIVREQEITIAELNEQQEAPAGSRLDEEMRFMREAMMEQEAVISQLRKVLDKSTKLTGQHRALRTQKAAPETPQSGDLFESVNPPPAVAPSDVSAPAAQARPAPPAPPVAAVESTAHGRHNPPSPSITLHAAAPADSDDLKKINGIGPAFERTLNRLGIYQFKQIAALTPDDIVWVARKIHSFPERLIRGRWVEQAKALSETA